MNSKHNKEFIGIAILAVFYHGDTEKALRVFAMYRVLHLASWFTAFKLRIHTKIAGHAVTLCF